MKHQPVYAQAALDDHIARGHQPRWPNTEQTPNKSHNNSSTTASQLLSAYNMSMNASTIFNAPSTSTAVVRLEAIFDRLLRFS
jgi:hypothetical protein